MPLPSPDIRREIRTQLVLILPVLLSQIALMTLGVVDTVMTGRYGSTDMAAVALAWAIWLPGLMFGGGLIAAVTPAVGMLHGAGEGLAPLREVIRQGVWLALLLTVPLLVLLHAVSYRLSAFGFSEELARIGGGYLRAMLWGGVPWLLFLALRSALEGFSLVRPAMFSALVAVLVNVPCNYAFIFGHWGAPELGGVGAGVASAITNWVMFLVLALYAWRVPAIRAALAAPDRPRLAPLRRLIAVGLPNALALLNEVGLFSVITLLLAPLGTISVAGHQVALNFSSIIFILPLSINIVATIRISHALGEKDARQIRRIARVALGLGLGLACVTALLTIWLRRPIAALYNPDPEVIALAATLLLIDATYQCTDALQTVGVGILRGYNDTRAIFCITLCCYWGVALPAGWVLGRTELLGPALGAAGFWIALVIGLSLASVCYLLRLRWLERATLKTL